MATKTTRKTATKAAKKSATSKRAGTSKTRQTVPRKKTPVSRSGTASSNGAATSKGSLRVRMYRIGFGDFFLFTVPTKSGPQHILIDCGVHAANIGSIDSCVKDMVQETGGKLALVIATHYHADHLSGFATHYNDFAKFEVGAVWITNRLDPGNSAASKFQAQLTSVANQLQMKLGARTDQESLNALDKVQNALGVAGGGNGGSNAKALKLLTGGFSNKPPVYYYQGGDEPELPDSLKGALTAQLLGPAPKDSGGTFSGTDNKSEQYLAAAGDEGLPDTGVFGPFGNEWIAKATDYPSVAFNGYRTAAQIESRQNGAPAQLESALKAAQPDSLLAVADALDGTLNNQSLVVLFTCNGKKLLFVGDAQWGNWSYWLYGKAVTGQDPGITSTAKAILSSIDFYKVGHHGSTNANPIPAVTAISGKCAAMCSTATGAYGSPAKKTEVPRTALMDALEKQTGNKMIRSDWIPVGTTPADPQAKSELAKLPANFSTGPLYIDYTF